MISFDQKRIYMVFLLLLTCQYFGYAKSNQTYFVYAESGLSLRNEASLGGKKIAIIPYGAKVLTISDSLYGEMVSVKEFSDFSLSGYWKYVQYDTLKGYVFDPYLCKLKPDATHKSDKEYFNEVTGQVGDEYNLKFFSLDCKSNPVGCLCGYEAEYNYGITYKYYSCRENGIEIEVVLPGVGLNEAYVFGKMLYKWDENSSISSFEAWNEIKVKPKDSGMGCYYTIQPYGRGGTRITYYCSC